jgi:hypothetical protein
MKDPPNLRQLARRDPQPPPDPKHPNFIGKTRGSPTVGGIDKDALVWFVNQHEESSGTVRAFNVQNGIEVFHDDVGAVPRYAPVTCAGPSVFVGTANGFVCYGVESVPRPIPLGG